MVLPELRPSSDEVEPDTQLNPKYSFDAFVIGSSNRFAHAAAVAVEFAPNLFIGVTERDAGNKELLSVPVLVVFQLLSMARPLVIDTRVAPETRRTPIQAEASRRSASPARSPSRIPE